MINFNGFQGQTLDQIKIESQDLINQVKNEINGLNQIINELKSDKKFSDDGVFSENSEGNVPSEKAVKQYVDLHKEMTNPILDQNLKIPDGWIYEQIDPFEIAAGVELEIGIASELIIKPSPESEPSFLGLYKYFVPKQYIGGQTYNGVTISLTASYSGVFVRGVFIPYQTFDLAWRLKFNIQIGSLTASGSNLVTFTVNGITYKNVANSYQGVQCSETNLTVDALGNLWAVANSGDIKGYLSSNPTNISLSADLELDSKPTWAD